jgi:dipeptidyl aminopeptidase/acylaminoacyl peptidase
MNRRNLMASGLVLVAVMGAAVAQEQPVELTLRNMTQVTRTGDVAVSPDGKTIAFGSNRGGGQKIWLIPTSGGEPHALVEGTSIQWSPDGKTIAFLSGRGTPPQVDIWTIPAAGGEPTRVTKEQSGKHGLRWSPDGTQMAYISNRAKDQDIWIVSAKGGEPRQLTKKTNEWDEFRWAPEWSPDGKHITFVSGRSDYYSDDLWMVDVDGSHLRKVTTGIWVMGNPEWSPDGKSIAFNGNKQSEYWYEDMSELYIYDVASGKVRSVHMDVDVSDFEMNAHVFWSPDSSMIYFRNISRGNTNIWAVPADGNGYATQITNFEGGMQSMDVAANGSAIAFTRATPVSSGDVWTMSASGGEATQLTRWATQFRDVRAPVQVSFRSNDGLYIHGYLYKPPRMDAAKKYPGLVSVHGGGTNSYANTFHAMEQYLAQKGYLVLAIEYRGSSGYGRPFQLLSVGDWTRGQGWDAVAASDFLRALPNCTGKIGVYGGSYGGIMSMAAVTRDPSKFQAAAPFFGIYDWVAAYDDADRLGKIFLVTGFDGFRPEDNPEMYYRNSTINFLKDVNVPLLIEHGELDRRAPYSQALRLVEALKKEGKTYEFFHYPNEQHGIRRPDNFVDAYTRMEAWFAKYLQ